MSDLITYWQNFDTLAGAVPLRTVERSAGFGEGTLRKAREQNRVPAMDVSLKLLGYFDAAPAALFGTAVPLELARIAGNNSDPAVRRLPLMALAASHLNPRRTFDETALAELAESIAQQGLLQNLVVRQDPAQPAVHWIVAGERRYRALMLLANASRLPAELAEHGIPCRIVSADEAQHRTLALLENLQRQDVNPMEEAEGLAHLQALDPKTWTTRAIAERLGVSQRHIQLRLQLVNNLAPEVQDALRSGEIKLAQARVIATQPLEEQLDLLENALDGAPTDELLPGFAFPVANAIFDVAASGLDIISTDRGDIFLDRDAAMTLQLDTAKARAAELIAGGCEFAEVDDVYRYREYVRCGDGTGVFILVRQEDGSVRVDTDLSRAAGPTTAAGAGAKVAQDSAYEKIQEARRRVRAEHEAASNDFLNALCAALDHNGAPPAMRKVVKNLTLDCYRMPPDWLQALALWMETPIPNVLKEDWNAQEKRAQEYAAAPAGQTHLEDAIAAATPEDEEEDNGHGWEDEEEQEPDPERTPIHAPGQGELLATA